MGWAMSGPNLVHRRPERCRRCGLDGIATRWLEQPALYVLGWHFTPRAQCLNPNRCADKLEAFDRADLLPLASVRGFA